MNLGNFGNNMETQETLRKEVEDLKKEVRSLKDMIEEQNAELSDEAKDAVEKSRKKDVSKFKSQEEIESKFL